MPPKKSVTISSSNNNNKQQTQNRLVIRDIEVDNFKSYSGKHRIGPFHKTFTTVIGPNGSGKSNVIDAMLFVFGKKSSKIRVAKFTELIHNSAAHPHVPSASVTVNFVEIIDDATDSTQRIEVPNTEFSVMRKVSKASGTSTFYIDHKASSQTEVVDLLKSKGVDLDHNRFLILQGEVEQIAMMKPRGEKEGEEGLVEYFDDLIGTNSMLSEITTAAEKASKAYEDRLDVLSSLKQAEKDRDDMKGARDACMEYVTQESNMQNIISLVVQRSALNLRDQIKEQLDRVREIGEVRKGHEARVVAIEDEARRIGEIGKEAKREKDKAEKEIQVVQDEKTQKEEEVAEKKAALESHEKARKRDQDRIKKYREEVAKLNLDKQNFARDQSIADQRRTEARNLIDELQPEFNKMQDEATNRTVPLKVRESNLIRKIDPFQRGMEEAEQDYKNAQHKYDTNSNAARKRAQDMQSLEARIESNKKQLASFEQLVAESDSSGSNLRERCLEAESERDRITEQFQRVAATIEASKNEYKSGQSDDQITSFLCSQSSLKGYIGPLRTLGRIDDRFDIAAGVAGGAVWGYHVVDTEETASAAMELLKRENRGRTSFIPLSKITREFGNQINAAFNAPHGATRLFDLIDTEARMKPAFYFAVRNTVVTDSTDRARELGLRAPAQQRLRCVTTSGTLVEPSGVFSGGGSRPRGADLRGTGGNVETNAKRQEAIAGLKKLQAELGDLNNQKMQAEDKVRQLQNQLSQKAMANSDRQRMQRNIMQIKTTIAADEERLQQIHRDNASGVNASFDDKQAKLQREIDEYYKEFQRREEELALQRRELDDVREQITSANGVEFKQLKDRLADMKQQEKDSEQKLASLRQTDARTTAKIENSEGEIQKLEQKIAAASTEEKQRDKEIVAELLQQLAVLNDKLRQMKAAVGDIEDRLDDLRKKTEELKEQRNFEVHKAEKCKQEEDALHAELKGPTQLMEKYKNKKKECEEKIIANAEKYGPETVQVIGGTRRGMRNNNNNQDQERENEDDEGENENDNDNDSSDSDDGEEDVMHVSPSRNKKNAKKKKHSTSAKSTQEGIKEEPVSEDSASFRLSQYNISGSPSGSPKNNNKRMSQGSPSSSQHLRNEDGTYKFDAKTFTTSVSEKDLRAVDVEMYKRNAKEINVHLEALKENINFEAIELWLSLDEKYKKIKANHDEILETYTHFHELEENLREERRVKFLRTFGVIQHKLKEVYQTITRSGDAELELVDSSDPFEGIRFTVRPPRKAWKAIGNLSGGEKTLSSLALVFALHHIRPTPVYVLDEIDAALDFRNVAIVGKYILEKGIGAQFIIISLRNNMFELAHQIVGISKVNDCTRSIVISPQFLSGRIKEACTSGALRARQQQQQQQINSNNNNSNTTTSTNNSQRSANNNEDGDGENMVPSKKHRGEEDE